MLPLARGHFIKATSAAALLSLLAATPRAARGIDERGFVRIGGIDQWIAIQGDDMRNPAIVYLHGGPAEAQSPFLSQFAPWEHDFTVVNWDQRGAGKTFALNGTSTPDMTIDRLVSDAIEVAQYARRRLNKRRVILVGQSFGCIIGVLAVLRRPDVFAAYVGTGQPVNWVLSLQERERYARSQMIAKGDTAALKKLDAAQSLPPNDSERLSATFKWRWAPSDFTYLNREGAFIGPDPDRAKGDAAAFVAGSNFSGPKLWKTATTFDARKVSHDFHVPVYVIQGRDDHIASNEAAKAWVGSLHAPAKAFMLIDGGHFACLTDTGEFIAGVREYVRPQ